MYLIKDSHFPDFLNPFLSLNISKPFHLFFFSPMSCLDPVSVCSCVMEYQCESNMDSLSLYLVRVCVCVSLLRLFCFFGWFQLGFSLNNTHNSPLVFVWFNPIFIVNESFDLFVHSFVSFISRDVETLNPTLKQV